MQCTTYIKNQHIFHYNHKINNLKQYDIQNYPYKYEGILNVTNFNGIHQIYCPYLVLQSLEAAVDQKRGREEQHRRKHTNKQTNSSIDKKKREQIDR